MRDSEATPALHQPGDTGGYGLLRMNDDADVAQRGLSLARFAFFTETAYGLVYREEAPSSRVRLLFLFFGTAQFAIPVPFVIHTQWFVMSWTTLLAAACTVAPVALGLTFIAIGLVSAQRLRFDRRLSAIVRTRRWPWGERHASFDFADVEGAAVHCNRHGDDGLTFQVVLRVRGRMPIKLGIWDAEAEAEHWRARVLEAVTLR